MRKSGDRILIITVLCAICALLVLIILGKTLGAGKAASALPVSSAESVQAGPAPTPTPEPTPMPTPAPEPELPGGEAVTVNGTELSVSFKKNGETYVFLSEAAQALGAEAFPQGQSADFIWRGQNVVPESGSSALVVGETEAELTAPIDTYRGELIVPIRSFCEALDISVLYDEEFSHIYCTPGAGSWELKEGYKVPVLMYHAVCDDPFEKMLYDMCVRPSEMEEQLAYLSESGYQTIFFEDLEHVEDYTKPIILTYDDGYDCLYTELFPLLKKYNAKIVVYLITNNVETGGFHSLSKEQIKEMQGSGLVSFQSHSVHHDEMIYLKEDELRREYYDSKLYITRLTGLEPIGFAYPYGMAYPNTMEICMEYYRFAVRMGSYPYYTGDDPSFLWRIYIERGTPLYIYSNKIDLADPERQSLNELS